MLPRVVLLATLLLLTPAARADVEVWNWLEYRQAILQAPGLGPRILWRVNTDFRFNTRSNGLHLAFLRMGPALDINEHLFIAFHGTAIAERLSSGKFAAEYRMEIEPWLQGRIGMLQWQDRNRFEVRFRPEGRLLRYRNMLRLNWAPRGAKAIPFVANEVLVDLSGAGFNQNRLSMGVRAMLGGPVGLDLGYMLRSRVADKAWVHDHVFLTFLFINAPRV